MVKKNHTEDVDSLGATIAVKLPNGQTTSVIMHKFDQMSKVYSLVSSETGAKESLIRIKYSGKVLKRNQSTSSLGLMTGMILKAEVITARVFNITVKVEGEDKEMSLQTSNTSTIKQLRQQVAELGYENSCHDFYFGSKLLTSSDEMLYDLKIGNNAVISVKAAVKAEKKSPAATSSVTEQSIVEPPSALPEFAAEGKSVEVVFSFDTTGSMYSVLTQVRENIRDLVDKLINDIPNIRIGLIAHGDYCDYNKYVVKVHDLSADAESLKNFAMNVPATGGGDSPEAYELVIKKAQEVDWSENSAKALVVIGDAVPHPPSMTDQDIYWHTELDILTGLDVKVYGVQAHSHQDSVAFYKELADRTNGAYVTFSNFSLIKDMFLAVCYNEASEEQLDDFRQQLDADGQLTNQKEEIFAQLREQQQAVLEDRAAEIIDQQIAFDPQQSRNYIKTAWFDRALDKSTPQYSYNGNTDKWSPYRGNVEKKTSTHKSTPGPIIVMPKAKSRKSGFRLNCFR